MLCLCCLCVCVCGSTHSPRAFLSVSVSTIPHVCVVFFSLSVFMCLFCVSSLYVSSLSVCEWCNHLHHPSKRISLCILCVCLQGAVLQKCVRTIVCVCVCYNGPSVSLTPFFSSFCVCSPSVLSLQRNTERKEGSGVDERDIFGKYSHIFHLRTRILTQSMGSRISTICTEMAGWNGIDEE